MKIIKRATAMLLATAMLFGGMAFTVPVNANEVLETHSIISQLEIIDFGRDVRFTPQNEVSARTNDATELLEFDSVEEFEAFVREFIAFTESMKAQETTHSFLPAPEEPLMTRSNQIFGPARASDTWWSQMVGGPFVWKNVDVSFMWFNHVFAGQNLPRAHSATVDRSWVTGLLIGVSWAHRHGSTSIHFGNNNRSYARTTIHGTWTIGASVVGVPINGVFNDVWVRDVLLIGVR